MRTTLLQFSLLLALLAPLIGANAPTTQPESPTLTDLGGVERQPLKVGSAKAAVILFIATECPISNGYAPEINRICREYESRGVVFYLVHTDPDLSEADAKKHAHDYGFTCPVLIDRRHELVKHVGASVTPEAVVIGADGDVVYRGRIDDLYVALGKRRFEATTHELRDALDAVLSGTPVKTPHTRAVGCAIS